MANADEKEQTSQQVQGDLNGTNAALDAKLAAVEAQLQQMNAGFAAMAAANNSRKQRVVEEEDIDPVYNSKGFKQQLLREADQIANAHISRERELNTVVYNLSQEYPEIQSDSKLKSAIIKARSGLPESIRETSAGYKAAILEAVSEAGLLPKSRRQVVDEDVSVGSGRSTRASSKESKARAKVTEDMLELAQLMGRNIEDKEVIKGLEEAANRDSWTKYK